MQFEVNVSDVAGITLQLRSYSQVIHAANVRLPWVPVPQFLLRFIDELL